ncbi:MAG: hypothetical protein AVDCRST_MAG26-2727 [uncultured Chloroflexia bacterium]|uniref:Oxygen sensor histidine kinase NreB n=1 Tax=uncultured Chloroflexia bacterium TaxID=1672391 RepID=A0A6J4J7V0_9CHLR|nr:MAG: hypothetical protein AVDCRST_MAG26-2727 [uncultured Chloroflexia bacterium]
MSAQPSQPSPAAAQRLDLQSYDGQHTVFVSALLAAVVACGVPLAQGLITGWPAGRLIAYSLLALVYVALTQIHLLPLRVAQRLCAHTSIYLTVMGLLGFVLQSISGDPFVQPIVFTIPFVHAAIAYDARRTAVVGGVYLLLLVLGLWASGPEGAAQILFPLASYGALLVFMYSFTRMAMAQAAARERADGLAADLARQRDYLQRLVGITAALTQDLELQPVLEQVAAAGQTLARAGQARVWLRDEGPDGGSDGLRLAAAVPALVQGTPAPAYPPSDVEATGGNGTTLVLPLRAKGAPIGQLELHDPVGAHFGQADAALLRPFADAAAIAIENARLYEQARLSATLAERNRLARELHDTIAQGLTATAMQIEAAQRGFERDPVRTQARLHRAHQLARETLDDVRRSVWTLASPLEDGQALPEVLDDLVHRFQERTAIEARYSHTGAAPKLEAAAATHAQRIVQEALQNVEKHARAAAVAVASQTRADELHISVRDNGVGFEPASVRDQEGAGGGFGLTSLRERARLVGGRVEIESAPGAGTSISVRIPLVKV